MKSHINNAAKITTNKVNEVFLFTEMTKYLNKTKTMSCYVKSVHSHAGFIDFQSQYTNKMEKVEIADLQIINFNRMNHEIRLCFLQVKYKRRRSKSFISFGGDLMQWELLKEKPNIVDSYKNGFPINILNFTNYKSITAYGIFYIDLNSAIDFFFTLPEHLDITSKVNKKITLKFNNHGCCPNAKCNEGITRREAISICSMVGFGNQLNIGNIGAPISNSNIHSYIANIINSIRSNNPDSKTRKILGEINIPFEKNNARYIDTLVIISNGKDG